jgi:hypothetical protein
MKNEVRYSINKGLSNRKEGKEVSHYEANPSIYPLFEKCPFISPSVLKETRNLTDDQEEQKVDDILNTKKR